MDPSRLDGGLFDPANDDDVDLEALAERGDLEAELKSDLLSEQAGDDWYGLAPHTHDLTLTGSLIGSTVMTPLPALTNGGVDLGWAWFVPDEDAPGMGVYRPYGRP